MSVVPKPIHDLAQQVLSGNLCLKEAMEQVTAPDVLVRLDNTIIDHLDDHIRDLAEQDLAQATVLAVLNHQIARHKPTGNIIRAHCNLTLGGLYLQQNDLKRALKQYQEALIIFGTMAKDQAPPKEIVAQIWHDIGEIRERERDFEAATKQYREALELAQSQRLKLLHLECDASNGLGRVYLAQEKVDDAMEAFEDALRLSKSGGDKHGEAMSRGNLGLANHFLGRLKEAEKLYEKAIELVAPSLIADLFNQEAEDCYYKAIELSRETSQAVTGLLLNGFGNVLIELGELSEAEKCLLVALDIARQRNDRWSEQQRTGNLGNLYQARAKREIDPQLKQDRLIQAEQHHQEAVAIARDREDQHGQATHLLNLGNVYSKLERFEEAEECYAEALDLAEKLPCGGVDIRWRVHSAWGDLCAAQDHYKPAYDHYAAAIEIVENQRDELSIPSRMKFWQERSILHENMVLCCLRLGKLWPALVYTEQAKARYLADLLAQHIPLEEDTQKLIEAAIEALPLHTAVVVFNVTEAGTVVFVVTNQLGGSDEEDVSDEAWEKSSDGRIRVTLVDNLKQDDLQRILVEVDDSNQVIGGYLVDYYANHTQWRESTLETATTAIYEALLALVHRKLTKLSVQRFVLMPNLGLSLLPLHACETEQDCLLDHYEITYVPSFYLLRHCQMRAPAVRSEDGHLLAVVDPEVAGPWPDRDWPRPLVWAPAGVEYIARFFSRAQILDGSEEYPATRKAVMAEMPDYDFVHFACHGQFNLREPMQSALKLAPASTDDGLLTLEDVLNLKLPHTPLVVMSACETSMVDPGDLADEYLGLQGGFLKAGALTVVASLWAVGDLPTALLMRRFYHNLRCRDKPMAPASALREAQHWLRDCPKADIEALLQELRRDLESTARMSVHVLRSARSWMRRLRLMDDRPFAPPYWWAAFQVVGWSSDVQDFGGETMDGPTLITLLHESLDDIQANLSQVEWEGFSQRLIQVLPRFDEIQDEAEMEDATDDLFEACMPYDYLQGLLRGAITIEEMRPGAPGQAPGVEARRLLQEVIQRVIIKRKEDPATSDQVAEESEVPVRDK